MNGDATRSTMRGEVRSAALTWAALVALMFSSLGSAYLRLGVFNLVAGLVVAVAKTTLVAFVFMRLSKAAALLRLVAVAGLGAWGLLVVLSGVDYLSRPVAPAPVERPQQLAPPWPDLETR